MSGTVDIKTAVQRQFGSSAERYRLSTVHSQGEDLAQMVTAAQLSGTERILDAGCGGGHASVTLAPHVAHVTALDITPEMLVQVETLAQERGITNLVTQPGDVENLPFDDGDFDRVTSRFSAHHYPNPRQAVREFARVLKPGGIFLLSDVIAPEAPAQDTFLQTIELLRDPSHVRDHRISEWLDMLAEVGLSAHVEMTWELALEFQTWVERIGTPMYRVDALRRLFDDAPEDIRAALKIGNEYQFTIPCALIVANKPAEAKVAPCES